MSKIYDFLTEMKTKLATIPDVKTIKIGMEKGIGSKDCVFIRIVPEINEIGKRSGGCSTGGMDEMTVQVIYGYDLKNHELEKLYSQFYELEELIRSTLTTRYTKGSVQFLHTVTDEDRLTTIKSAISRFKVIGIR